MSFIFGGDTGITYEALQQRRKIAEQLAQGKKQPRNVAEGLASAAESVTGALLGRSLDKKESKMRDEFNAGFQDLIGGGFDGGGASSAPTRSDTMGSGSSAPSGQVAEGAASLDGETKTAFNVAAEKIGLNERDQNAALSEFLENGGQNLDPATTAWCAAFVNASLNQAGPQGTGKLNARSYMDWGQEVQDPQRGDVAVFSRGDPKGWQGHVGFFDSYNDDGTINVLGGNQSDGVNISPYSQDSLLGFRRAGGGAPSAPSRQGGGNNARIAQLISVASSPLATPQQQAVVQALLQREMQASDPMRQMEIERARLELEQMRNPQPEAPDTQYVDGVGLINKDTGEVIRQYDGANAGSAEYGLTPQYVQRPDGSLGIIQLSKDGTAKEVDLPEGLALQKGVEKLDLGTSFQWYNTVTGEAIGDPIPKDKRGEAAEAAAGRVEGEAEAQKALDAPGTIAQADETIRLIDQVLTDPALPSVVGKVQGRMNPEGVTGMMMSQDALNLMPKIEQLQGKAFLQAFEGLKGGGQITEREGQAATAAITRLNQRYVDDATYKEALQDLKRIANNAKARARGENVSEYVPQWFEGDETESPARGGQGGDIPPAPEGIDGISADNWPAIWDAMAEEDRKAFQ